MVTPERERHRRYADRFAAVIADVGDWTAPTPVPEWSAADIPGHLIDWLPHILGRWSGITLRETSGNIADRWESRASELDGLLEDSATAEMPVADGPFAGQRIAALVDQIYTPDVYMHGLDLARSAGLSTQFDLEYARQLLDGMRLMNDALRASGQFGPAFTTTSADPVDQLMAFIGRDPAWTARPPEQRVSPRSPTG